MHAIRNINLCTKDCLCLYVCPTGATNTETGQIDFEKCIDGCRLCVDACPSHALTLVPDEYPAQQAKSDDMKKLMGLLSKSKTQQELIALQLQESSSNLLTKQLNAAITMSNRIMAEDILRESGFMLPQSDEAIKLLQKIHDSNQKEAFPKDSILKLIKLLSKSPND